MTNIETLQESLMCWKEYASVEEPHLDETTLYHLASADGLVGADQANLRHLSLCPVCIDEWANWRHARSAVEDAEDAATYIDLSYGFLQAAASPQLTDGVSMQSQCGSYRLDILPQEGSDEHGLAIFEVVSGPDHLKSAQVTVHDRHGRLLLEGHLTDGRLARPIKSPGQFDLSTWTVAIDANRTDRTS